MSAISPVPKEPVMPAALCRGALAPAHEGWSDNRSQPDARRERSSGRISRPSQWSVAASPFSISPATSLAKSRAQQRGVPEKPTSDEAVAVCSKGRDYHPGGPSSMTFQAERDHSLSGHVTQASPPD